MQRDTARLAASGANETAGPAPLEQERRAPRLVRKRFLKLGKRTPPRHRSFIPAIPHGRLDHSHTICSSYLSQRDKPCAPRQWRRCRLRRAPIGSDRVFQQVHTMKLTADRLDRITPSLTIAISTKARQLQAAG